MRIITTIGVIIFAIGILFYIGRESVSIHAVPSLQEYIASTTASNLATTDNEENQAGVAWLASSTIIDTLLSRDLATSSASTSVLKSPALRAPPFSKGDSNTSPIIKNNSLLTQVKTSKGVVYVTVMKTPETRAQGLGGYKSLDADKGMLFIFPKPDKPDFWMKDMNFPIDIVWINSARKIIGVETNISPKTYPKIFSPTDKIQFVIEVNAGLAEKLGLITGTTVVF